MAYSPPDRPERTNSTAPLSDAYRALMERLGSREHRILVAGEARRADHPLLAAMRRGEPVTVNAFQLPRQFRPDGVSPSEPVTVHPNGRIEVYS